MDAEVTVRWRYVGTRPVLVHDLGRAVDPDEEIEMPGSWIPPAEDWEKIGEVRKE